MPRPITLYLNEEAADCLEWLRTAGDIPKGWLSKRMQQAIVREYKKQARDL